MAKYITTTTELKSIANTIRSKGGTSAPLTYPIDFINAINAIAVNDSSPVIKPLKIITNGTITAPVGIDGYNPIEVVVPSDQKPEIAGNETINKNGNTTFNPPQGKVYSSFTVNVSTPSPKPEQIYNKTYTSNGNYPIKTENGKVINGGNITVNCPVPKAEQEKEVNIINNGSTTIFPDDGKVLKKAIVNVNVPKQKPEETKQVKYTSNGERTISATDGKVMTAVTVNVAVPSDKKPEITGEQTITTNGSQTFTPPAGSVFSSFTTNVQVPIPTPVIKPLNVSSNGTYNVPKGTDGYNPVTVNCPVPKKEQTKSLDITANGNYNITPDAGMTMSQATAKVNIPYSTFYTGSGAPSNSLGVDGDIYFQK